MFVLTISHHIKTNCILKMPGLNEEISPVSCRTRILEKNIIDVNALNKHYLTTLSGQGNTSEKKVYVLIC